MARGPQQHQRNEWVHFFAGTPRRFLWTALGVYVTFMVIAPDPAGRVLVYVLTRITSALGPSVTALMQIGIALVGLWMILGVFKPKKTKKKGDH